ncbi:MAG: hypothetical protein DRO00_00260 [Thermoproteota archaeon]|nr:MAG: hypothetical protein DRO00_00260 [Candidatus Korarchaeota archaeon]
MCEFTVILSEDGREDKVAEDIVRTTYQNGELVLMDILGDRISVGGALITEVNVDSEVLRILRDEILRSFIKFLETYEKCKESGVYDDELKKAWEVVKSTGDSLIKELALGKNK